MTRGLTPSEEAVATGRNAIVVPMIEVLFDSGPLRLCMGGMQVVSGGYIWYATQALNIDTTAEAAGSTEGFRFSLSGLDTAIINIAASEPYWRRPISVYEQYLDANYAPVAPPRLEWRGRMVSLTIQEQGREAVVAGDAEHWDAEERRPRVTYYNGAHQRRQYPSDTGFSKVEQMAEITVVWPTKEALMV